jgi:hypothetical protein
MTVRDRLQTPRVAGALAAQVTHSSDGRTIVVKVKKSPAKASSSSRGAKDSGRKSRRAGSSRETSHASRASGVARRNFIVFLSLVGLLSFTSVLLLALSPDPLIPSASASLFALDAPQSMDAVFRTASPLEPSRWKYVFVHHSQTPEGSAQTLVGRDGMPVDHFVIGNGDGAIDGEIQITQRWAGQVAAAPAPGLDRIGQDCVSICVIGDFDRSAPTPTQTLRLTQLVGALQRKLQIGAGQVILVDAASSPAGTGKRFPATAFRTQLLP